MDLIDPLIWCAGGMTRHVDVHLCDTSLSAVASRECGGPRGGPAGMPKKNTKLLRNFFKVPLTRSDGALTYVCEGRSKYMYSSSVGVPAPVRRRGPIHLYFTYIRTSCRNPRLQRKGGATQNCLLLGVGPTHTNCWSPHQPTSSPHSPETGPCFDQPSRGTSALPCTLRRRPTASVDTRRGLLRTIHRQSAVTLCSECGPWCRCQ